MRRRGPLSSEEDVSSRSIVAESSTPIHGLVQDAHHNIESFCVLLDSWEESLSSSHSPIPCEVVEAWKHLHRAAEDLSHRCTESLDMARRSSKLTMEQRSSLATDSTRYLQLRNQWHRIERGVQALENDESSSVSVSDTGRESSSDFVRSRVDSSILQKKDKTESLMLVEESRDEDSSSSSLHLPNEALIPNGFVASRIRKLPDGSEEEHQIQLTWGITDEQLRAQLVPDDMSIDDLTEMELEELADEVEELRCLMADMHRTIREQEPLVEDVSANIQRSNSHIDHGVGDLRKASKWKALGLTILGAGLGALVGGPVGFLAGAKGGAALGACAAGGGALGAFLGKTLGNATSKL